MKCKMLNADIDTVEKLYLKKDWQKIIRLRNHIRIPTDNPLVLDDFVHDQPNSIWEIIDRDGIVIHANDSIFGEIKNFPSCLLDYPNDIFFVDRSIRKRIPRNPGVLLFTQKSSNAIPLKMHWSRELAENDRFAWDTFLGADDKIKHTSSNALIINDHFMFTRFNDGVQNLLDILDSLLPMELNGVYHVLLSTDRDQLFNDKSISTLDQAIEGILEVIRALDRKYRILFETLLIRRAGKEQGGYWHSKEDLREFYKQTHDRLIISNYFRVNATKALCAVKQSKNGEFVSKEKQTISFDGIYSGIDNKFQDISSLPDKGCHDFIEDIRRFISASSPICEYYCGSKRGDVHHIQNRLIAQ